MVSTAFVKGLHLKSDGRQIVEREALAGSLETVHHIYCSI